MVSGRLTAINSAIEGRGFAISAQDDLDADGDDVGLSMQKARDHHVAVHGFKA